MKKRAVSFLLVILMLSMLCMTVFAVSVPEFTYKNGDTYLGIFRTSKMTDELKTLLKEWLSAERTALIRLASGQIQFLIFPINANAKVTLNSDGSARLWKLGAVDAYGVSWGGRSDDGYYESSALVSFRTGYFYDCTILGGSIFQEITMPTPVNGYIADITGVFGKIEVAQKVSKKLALAME